MKTYRIEENKKFGSREVFFAEKPSEEVRTALKGLKMRWNPKRSCWYGFASESELIAALLNAGESVTTDGYLGGGAFYGKNAVGKFLYGADLSAAIRAELKAHGIKGVTISCRTYTGGQELTAKVKFTGEDLATLDELRQSRPLPNVRFNRIGYGDKQISFDEWAEMDWNEEATAIYESSLLADLERAGQGADINEYRINEWIEYTVAFRAKLEAVRDIIESYRYDESNSMVDYFDTNFYYTIKTVRAAA